MESPSPFNPLGAKGIAEGNCMSTPVCIGNAVADALGVKDVKLPLTPARVKELMGLTEKPPRTKSAAVAPAAKESRTGAKALTGTGSLTVAVDAEHVWRALSIPPACAHYSRLSPARRSRAERLPRRRFAWRRRHEGPLHGMPFNIVRPRPAPQRRVVRFA